MTYNVINQPEYGDYDSNTEQKHDKDPAGFSELRSLMPDQIAQVITRTVPFDRRFRAPLLKKFKSFNTFSNEKIKNLDPAR